MKETPASSIIEEYFNDVEEDTQAKAGKQVFSADDEDVDIKTELNDVEIYNITALKMYDKILEDYGIGSIFDKFYNNYFRLKISRNRQSRGEFVKISSSDKSEDIVEGIKTSAGLIGGNK